jgi:hypothetical protein
MPGELSALILQNHNSHIAFALWLFLFSIKHANNRKNGVSHGAIRNGFGGAGLDFIASDYKKDIYCS